MPTICLVYSLRRIGLNLVFFDLIMEPIVFSNLDEWISFNLTNNEPVRLHLGCGSKYWNGWCNIDAFEISHSDTHRGSSINPDLWLNISELEAQASSVDVICTHHVLEHFYRHEVVNMIKQWITFLKPGGIIITEMPDLERLMLLLRIPFLRPIKSPDANRDIIKAQLYGASWEINNKFYPYHKYVWDRKEFVKMLEDLGLEVVYQSGATSSHKPFRDMAVVCRKPISTNDSTQASSINVDEELDKFYPNKIAGIFLQLRGLVSLFRH